MQHLRVLVIAMLIVVAALATAQTSESGSVTIEKLYLESETSPVSIRAQLQSDSLELQMSALRALEQQVDQGLVDPNSADYVAFLDYAANRGLASQARQPYRLPAGYRPQVRMYAADLLRHSKENFDAILALSKLLESDPEPLVRSRAILALASIGRDPKQFVSLSMGTALRSESLTSRDEHFIYSSLIAIERLGDQVGMWTLHPEALGSTVLVATGGYNRLLREKALEILDKM